MLDVIEVVGRVTLIYAGVFVLLRLAGKRELGSLSPMDLLTMLLLSETVSPALVGGSDSLGLGMVAATTLIALTVILGFATFRFRRVERMVEGTAKVLIRDGRVDADVLRGERITHEQLLTALHENGLMSVSQVKRAFVEPTGDLTFIEKKQ